MMLASCASPSTPTQVPIPVPVTTDPPIFTCPAAQTAQSLDGTATPVPFTAPSVLNGQAPVTTSCSPAAGSPFTIGQATVTCTATDALQRRDSCAFIVTVLPPPRLSTTSFLPFGDSITPGGGGQNSRASSQSLMSARFHPSVLFPAGQRYPSELQAELASRYRAQSPAVDNQGVPG